jgi:hypothetical protein
MRRSRLFTVGVLFSSFTWVMAGGCSASNDDKADGPPTGNSAGTGGGTQGDPTKVTGSSGTNGGLTNELNPLCGDTEAGTCKPDDLSACSRYVPPEPGAGGAGGESSEGGAAAGGASGAGGAEPSSVGGEGGGSSGAGGEGGVAPQSGGAGGAGGLGGAGPTTPGELAAYSCQVTRQGSQLLRQCVPAGTGGANAPCFSAADCAPAFACVTENDAGRCLPYCCGQDTQCKSGTFCSERPLRKAPSDTTSAEPPRVPVCVPADACSLEEQFPCVGSECRCKGDTACMVVRGTTTCLKPGTGQQGDDCPCAWNHVCSSVTNKCIEICRTDPTKNDCGEQKCQASSELPQNFGVCVGPLK